MSGVGRRISIRFGEGEARTGTAWMTFREPAASHAWLVDEPVQGAGLEVVSLVVGESNQEAVDWIAGSTSDTDSAAPVYVKVRGVELWWRPGKAVVQCQAQQSEAMLRGLAEFAHYESELRRIEAEVAAAWGEVDEDKRLAFDVTSADLRQSKVTGARVERTFGRRIRLARIEPHLYEPDRGLTAQAQKLGEELRERAGIELRLETLDGQMEVFEHIYELGSQRMGEYKAAQQSHRVEWLIIWLLAAEGLLMLAQTLMKARS